MEAPLSQIAPPECGNSNASAQWPAGLLYEALRWAKPYVGQEDMRNVQARDLTVRVFPERAGKGHLYASDGRESFLLSTTALQGLDAPVHVADLSSLLSLLRNERDVIVSSRVEAGQTVWQSASGTTLKTKVPAETHDRFPYLPLKYDHYVLAIARKNLPSKAVSRVRSQAALAWPKPCTLKFDSSAAVLSIQGVDGSGAWGPIRVPTDVLRSESRDVCLEVSAAALLRLLTRPRSQTFTLRMFLIEATPKVKRSAFLRTVEVLRMTPAGKIVRSDSGSSECIITRSCIGLPKARPSSRAARRI